MWPVFFLINALSTVILAASNYCMQCLGFPSSEGVDNAHIQQQCLHIGVHSIKNLCVGGVTIMGGTEMEISVFDCALAAYVRQTRD